ncbi:hypothetical protein [Methylocystis sp. H15]|uniref:hypothetical protein n=1 Tax=Methylocystis sp. H15 TaxID=2785787 RepID=UPI0032B2E9C9
MIAGQMRRVGLSLLPLELVEARVFERPALGTRDVEAFLRSAREPLGDTTRVFRGRRARQDDFPILKRARPLDGELNRVAFSPRGAGEAINFVE